MTHPNRAPELAVRLIERFGSIGDTLSATPFDRSAILGSEPDIERTLHSVWFVINHMLRGRIARRPILSTEPAVIDYLRCGMGFEPIEQFRVLFLNAANELIADEVMATGTVSAVHPYPREIVKRCLELGATALILTHNHPSGNLAPSKADIELTRHIVGAAHSLGIVVHDHLVVAKNGCTSFRRAGLL